MEVRITGRHGELGEDVKEYALGKIEPLGRFNRHALRVDVVFDEDNLVRTIELIAHLDRGAPVVVSARHEDVRAVIDLGHDKLERALRRTKERREQRRHQRIDGVPPSADEAVDGQDDEE